jgi:hypothetical protein
MLKRIVKLLKEPSTYAGLAGTLAGLNILGLTAQGWEAVFGVVAAVAGAIAVIALDSADKEDKAEQ